MTEADQKADLRRYLQLARDAVLWKLDGLSEYDVRRPLTPTGTNLLGLVKHLSTVELLYLGFVFGRHFAEQVPWFRPDLGPNGLEPNTDLWATATESREDILGVYRRACAHADATIEALDLDATGRVPWWPERDGAATLHRVLAHLIAETHRHAGHADIVRELVDGAAGWQAAADFLPPRDQADWARHRDRIEQAAREAGGIG
ncbi:DinB family protein [Solihabitans fulvus]|uniref:DinB family protein n=1 Tax=Solihabitans fulvus TaxID=1892852 RepID=A0A5B2X317_9PSEU|nr:DinB family protein [Solihabitans fulvus]KAA2257561.1 DinB family protein [Solihabitans fulvus]